MLAPIPYVANTQSNRYDGQAAWGQRLFGNQLDTADNDGRKHHDGSAAQNRLRHDGNHSTQLRTQTAQDEEDCTGGDGKAVDHLGHCNQTYVLAEGGVGKNTEESGKGGAQTVADDAAGQFFVGSFSTQSTLHNTGDVAHCFHSGDDEHNQNRQDGTQVKYRFDWHQFGDFKPRSACHLVPV